MPEHDGCAADAGLPRWARRRGALVLAMVVWLPLLLAEPIARTSELHPAWPSWLGLAVAAALFVACGVVGTALSATPPGVVPPVARLRAPLLAGLGAVTVALVARSPDSAMLFALLVTAAVVVLDARPGLAAVAAITGAAAATVGWAGGTSDRLATAVVVTALSGLGCWSFRRLFAVIAELAATRERLARSAVEQERARFSRDLHDLLGHTLSVIVVKAQAVRRLAPLDAEATAQHAADIETIGRRALTEVRQAVDGYREVRFAAELDRAREALAAAGIAVAVARPESAPPLPAGVDALFGWVLREGVTNVLRHSGARRCSITLVSNGVTARLEIRDDGDGGPAADRAAAHVETGVEGGHGLAGLRERVAATGGRLEAGGTAEGFRLCVEVPLAGAAPAVASAASPARVGR